MARFGVTAHYQKSSILGFEETRWSVTFTSSYVYLYILYNVRIHEKNLDFLTFV